MNPNDKRFVWKSGDVEWLDEKAEAEAKGTKQKLDSDEQEQSDYPKETP